ncbi:MAG: hypothetical protein OEZ39_14525 [Gammaproteobacteria bacterium]|nr:hypothetical protein [Gammaproteobacteria bacterium]
MNNIEDYGVEDYILLDSDLAGLSIQAGFVEGVIEENKTYTSLEKAFRHIFRNNLEYAVMLWNGIPIRLDYRQDIPEMVSELVSMLEFVNATKEDEIKVFKFLTPNIETEWQVAIQGDQLEVTAKWFSIVGDYAEVLNQLGMIVIRRDEFMSEWKLLLEQFIQAITDSGAILTRDKAINELASIKDINHAIPCRGRLYRRM